jgi:hypothetical protein
MQRGRQLEDVRAHPEPPTDRCQQVVDGPELAQDGLGRDHQGLAARRQRGGDGPHHRRVLDQIFATAQQRRAGVGAGACGARQRLAAHLQPVQRQQSLGSGAHEGAASLAKREARARRRAVGQPRQHRGHGDGLGQRQRDRARGHDLLEAPRRDLGPDGLHARLEPRPWFVDHDAVAHLLEVDHVAARPARQQ